MPDYEITIKLDGDGSQTARGAAEGAYMSLMRDMFYGPLVLELRDKETGDVQVIGLEAELENDQSMLRFMSLMMVAAKYMTEEQRRELEEWEVKNIDGHSVGTSDWPGWEPLIGKQPMKFRKAAATRP
jgi:hypothetical protein